MNKDNKHIFEAYLTENVDLIKPLDEGTVVKDMWWDSKRAVWVEPKGDVNTSPKKGDKVRVLDVYSDRVYFVVSKAYEDFDEQSNSWIISKDQIDEYLDIDTSSSGKARRVLRGLR